MLLYTLLGVTVALVFAFTCVAGWRDVINLFRETEQERIDREFAAIVSTFDRAT